MSWPGRGHRRHAGMLDKDVHVALRPACMSAFLHEWCHCLFRDTMHSTCQGGHGSAQVCHLIDRMMSHRGRRPTCCGELRSGAHWRPTGWKATRTPALTQ